MWEDDPLFARTDPDAVGNWVSPAFRLSALFPYRAAHPYALTSEWQALFEPFVPVLEERCDRIRLWAEPGGKARRHKAIQAADWEPFARLKEADGDIDSGMFTGFYFVDRTDGREMGGRGPCAFRFFVGSAIRLDACIPLADWRAGALDIDRIVAALTAIPYVSFLAGYGLCLDDRFAQGDDGGFAGQLMPIARKFPALDLMHAEKRSWFPGDENDFAELGLAGINWITGIGDAFAGALGGADRFQAPASEIEVISRSNGVALRLGATPISGFEGSDDAYLPLYSAVGRAIAPVWTPQPRPSPVFGDDHMRESLAWERRFFGEG